MIKRRVNEQLVLLYNVFRWFVLATIIGTLVGASTAVFLKALDTGIHFAGRYPWYFTVLPLVLCASALLIRRFAPDAAGHGTEKVIEAVHRRSGRINAAVVPVKLVTTVMTIAAGGSAGKEGPCAQIGAGIASLFADVFKFIDADRKTLVICGISAGFASVFGTPVAGAIFGVEVIFAGKLLYEVLLPSIIAGMVGFQVTSHLGVTYFYHPIAFVPVFSQAFFLKVVLAGVFFGFCAFILIEILTITSRVSGMIRLSSPVKGLLGGAILVVLALIFSKTYLGLGLETIRSTLEGGNVPWYAFLVKSLFTGVTLGFGGSGGIITPTLFVGASSGALFAGLMHLDIATFSALGLVSVLAGATNAPIAASIMAIELFGAPVAPYAAIACVISYFMTGHRSVYPSQIMVIKKSTHIDFEANTEVGDVQDQFVINQTPGDALRKYKKRFM